MNALPSILDVRAGLFPTIFAGASGAAWRVVAAACFGLGLDSAAIDMSVEQAMAIYRDCTGRVTWVAEQVRELWLVIGRRGGKTLFAALALIYLACFRAYRLAPGEVGVVMLLAADRRQAKVVKKYVSGLMRSVPMLADLILKETEEAIELSNGVAIEITTASFRSLRGRTVVAAVGDELAFWANEDAADPDTEILAALRPAMATVPGALLIVLSSPYSRRGELWNAYRRHFGKDGDDVLVWKAPTRTMNPTVPESVIARAMEDDEPRARAEYLAEFRTDVEGFVSREALDAVTDIGVKERPRAAGVIYRAGVDMSGMTVDSSVLTIAHQENETAILDVVREIKPPCSPEAVVAEFADLLRRYGVDTVTGDRYAGEWPRDAFRKAGITYELTDLSRSDLYRELLPLVNSGRVALLDDPRLLNQAANLERRIGRGGRDNIDHAPGGHDDVINAAAIALRLVSRPVAEPRIWVIDLD